MGWYAFYPPPGGSTLAPGSATAANQVLEIAQLTAINSNTTGLATEAKQDDEITAINQVDTDLLAFSAKTASALVSDPFDYQDITYVGATTDIDQVIYKTGGAAGTIIATLTMGYDGSNRLTSVTRS